MKHYERDEQDQIELNAVVGEHKESIEELISIQTAADEIAAAVAKRFADAPIYISSEQDEIDERRARIATIAAHLEVLGADIAVTFPSEFDAVQAEQAAAGREVLAAQQAIDDKRKHQEMAKHARAAKRKATAAVTTKPSVRLVSKGTAVVEDIYV